MIFWSILFLSISLYVLFKGSVFSLASKKLKSLNIRSAEGENSNELIEEYIKTGCFPLIVSLIMVIAEAIYLTSAISVDPHKIPTLIAIAVYVLSWAIALSKKKYREMSKEELEKVKAKLEHSKNRTFSGTLRAIFWSGYYIYMLYILIYYLGA